MVVEQSLFHSYHSLEKREELSMDERKSLQTLQPISWSTLQNKWAHLTTPSYVNKFPGVVDIEGYKSEEDSAVIHLFKNFSQSSWTSIHNFHFGIRFRNISDQDPLGGTGVVLEIGDGILDGRVWEICSGHFFEFANANKKNETKSQREEQTLELKERCSSCNFRSRFSSSFCFNRFNSKGSPFAAAFIEGRSSWSIPRLTRFRYPFILFLFVLFSFLFWIEFP